MPHNSPKTPLPCSTRYAGLVESAKAEAEETGEAEAAEATEATPPPLLCRASLPEARGARAGGGQLRSRRVDAEWDAGKSGKGHLGERP